jgi:hypothetical protein
MLRALLVAAMALGACAAHGQADSAASVSYARAVRVPLNALLLHDKALDAWNWTFGREPGAKLQLADRANGQIEGLARVNYRSAQLSLREETMGVVQYRVVISVRAGECRIHVGELTHAGNRSTPRGGVHLGLLTRGEAPARRLPGVGGATARRIHAEVKNVAEARIQGLLQAFEARLRAHAGP